MRSTKQIAFFCHLLATLPMLIGGLIYFFRETYLPYHADATQQTWESLQPGIQILFQALINGAGGLMLMIAVTLITLLLMPFRQGEQWSYWAIPLIGTGAMLITLRSTLLVTMNTAASPPWIVLLIVLALYLFGLIFSLISLKQTAQ